jgi:3-isopropylmalate/(R)-2-methylmalate dehydratase large subunit
MSHSTLFDKLWETHVVRELDEGWSLLYIDRHLLHDLSGPSALAEVRTRNLPIHEPGAVFATPDHLVSSDPRRTINSNELGGAMWANLRTDAERTGIRRLEPGSGAQGIVHVVGPELGIVLPGLTVICGDSHTCTNGALGALAFGVGSSQSAQALATQVLAQQRPRQMRIRLEGVVADGVTAKDIALGVIGRLGASCGTGYSVEYAGPVVDALDMEGRFTLCNLTVELGAKFGLIAPDVKTCDWVRGRPFAPSGNDWEQAVEAWRGLCTDVGATFDRNEAFDVRNWAPIVTWGTSPEHVVEIDGVVPDPATAADDQQRMSWRSAIDYMGLEPGRPIAGTPVDWVFIGSCANSRLSDLRAAAAVAAGNRVAPGVTAWVVPGSEQVQAAAEAEGIDDVFSSAGFEWRSPGCSMCVAANGERVPPGARCVSTSNRNFVGRQGPGARTHLASPAMAAAAAIAGQLVDVRSQ